MSLKAQLAPGKSQRELIEEGWKRFTVILPREKHRQLKQLSIETDTDMSDIVMLALEDWLNKQTTDQQNFIDGLLEKPIKLTDFAPLSRDDLHDRVMAQCRLLS